MANQESPVSLERLRQVLDYAPDTGEFKWREVPLRSPVKVGDIAGGNSAEGYTYLTVDFQKIPAQRGAWFYHHGVWPTEQVAHRDGNRKNNSIANLYLIEKIADKTRELTHDRLRALLNYDPETGDFTWLVTASNRAPAGSVAGAGHPAGYRFMAIDGKRYLSHRIAFFYMTGRQPENMIDHINGDRADNRWANLREATAAQNAWNSGPRPSNTSGYKGVSFSKSKNKWTARISKNYHLTVVGYFDTKEEAAEACEKAMADLHGDFVRKKET